MFKKIILVLLAVIILMVVFRDSLIKVGLEYALTQAMGAETKVGSFHLGITKPVVEINNLKIYNPRNFINEPLLNISKIALEYEPAALMRRQLYISEMTIRMDQLIIAINNAGGINVDHLKIAHPPKDQKPAEIAPFKVTKLTLTVGKVVTKNYANTADTAMTTLDLGMREHVYKNINSFTRLVECVLVDTMKAAGVKGAQIYGEGLLNNLARGLVKHLNAKVH